MNTSHSIPITYGRYSFAGRTISVSYRMEGVAFIPIFLFFLSYILVSTNQHKLIALKWVFILLVISLCVCIIVFIIFGQEWASFNNTSNIILIIKDILLVKSTTNYILIYNYLHYIKDTYPVLYEGCSIETVINLMPCILLCDILYSIISIINIYMSIPLVLGIKYYNKKWSIYCTYVISVCVWYFVNKLLLRYSNGLS
jgi:hypothetical protein